MTDLTERLRTAAKKLRGWSQMALATDPETVTGNTLLYEEAADEIESLTARLAEANAEVKRLTTAWRAIDRANVSLRERLAAAQTRNVCPECGLTPGAISTCYCEECVGEIKEKLAAAETEVENLRLQCAAFDYSLTQAEDSAAARMQERDECRRLLREACEMPRYCTRFEDWKERAAKAGGCDA